MSKWLVAGAVALSLALALALHFKFGAAEHGSGPQRYVTVDELLAAPDTSSTFRVNGHARSIVRISRTDDRAQLIFELHGKTESLVVKFDGVPPDLFREGSDCVVVGTLVRKGDGLYELHSSELFAKTPSF